MKTIKHTIYFAIAAVFVFSVAACGNSGGGSAPKPKVAAVPTPKDGHVIPDCSGCPNDMAFLNSALGYTMSGGQTGMELALDFFGDPAILGGSASIGSTANLGYYGPVAASGRLVVMVPNQLCGIPAGEYTVETVTPGNWNAQSFYNLQLVAHGPSEIHLALYSGFISAATPARKSGDGENFPFKLQVVSAQIAGSTMYACPVVVF